MDKPLKDTVYGAVSAHRYRCLRCKRTFRVYPQGVTQAQTSQRVKGLGVMLYLLGLSYGATSLALEALGVYMCKCGVSILKCEWWARGSQSAPHQGMLRSSLRWAFLPRWARGPIRCTSGDAPRLWFAALRWQRRFCQGKQNGSSGLIEILAVDFLLPQDLGE